MLHGCRDVTVSFGERGGGGAALRNFSNYPMYILQLPGDVSCFVVMISCCIKISLSLSLTVEIEVSNSGSGHPSSVSSPPLREWPTRARCCVFFVNRRVVGELLGVLKCGQRRTCTGTCILCLLVTKTKGLTWSGGVKPAWTQKVRCVETSRKQKPWLWRKPRHNRRANSTLKHRTLRLTVRIQRGRPQFKQGIIHRSNAISVWTESAATGELVSHGRWAMTWHVSGKTAGWVEDSVPVVCQLIDADWMDVPLLTVGQIFCRPFWIYIKINKGIKNIIFFYLISDFIRRTHILSLLSSPPPPHIV